MNKDNNQKSLINFLNALFLYVIFKKFKHLSIKFHHLIKRFKVGTIDYNILLSKSKLEKGITGLIIFAINVYSFHNT